MLAHLHAGAVAAWIVASLPSRVALPAAGSDALRARRRRTRWLVWAEHAAFVTAVALGLWAMHARGWTPARAGWLGLKVGLTAFLLVPLEAFHVWIHHAWIAPGLAGEAAAAQTKRWERGESMDTMLRSLSLPLLALAVPLMVWLSLARPG